MRSILIVAFALGLSAAAASAQRAALADSARTLRTDLQRYRAVGDSSAVATAHNALAMVHWSSNRYDSALVHLYVARELRIALGDSLGLARVLNNLGSTHYQAANYEPAIDAFLHSLALRRAGGDRRGAALVLANVGKVYHDWGRLDLAAPMLDSAIGTAMASGDPFALGYSYLTAGQVQLDRGALDSADVLLNRALASYHTVGVRPTDSTSAWSQVSVSRAEVALRRGDARGAIALLRPVLTHSQQVGSNRGLAQVNLALARSHQALGDHAAAATHAAASLRAAQRAESRGSALEALDVLARAAESRGQHREALGHLRAYHALRDSVFNQAAARRLVALEAAAAADAQARENARLLQTQRDQQALIARQRMTVTLSIALLALATALVAVLVHYNRRGREREQLLARANAELGRANDELRTALSEVRTLKGLIPICARCKKVRDDQGFWEQVETYIASRSDAMFSHGICSTCGPELYGTDWEPSVRFGRAGASTRTEGPADP